MTFNVHSGNPASVHSETNGMKSNDNSAAVVGREGPPEPFEINTHGQFLMPWCVTECHGDSAEVSTDDDTCIVCGIEDDRCDECGACWVCCDCDA